MAKKLNTAGELAPQSLFGLPSDYIVSAHTEQSLAKGYSAQELASKVMELSNDNVQLAAQNSDLQGKLQQIFKLLDQTLTSINIPSKITWMWALMNIGKVVELIKNIVKVIKGTYENMYALPTR